MPFPPTPPTLKAPMDSVTQYREASKALKARLEAGGRASPFWLCGPCVIEDRETVGRIARTLVELSARHEIPVVFKASFDKANRTSIGSFRGRGLDAGLEELLWVKREFGLPILTDVHESTQVAAVAEVADILQIPAFLCRQTDLIAAACRTGRLVNVKKGQFLAPANVTQLVQKLEHFACRRLLGRHPAAVGVLDHGDAPDGVRPGQSHR